MSSSLFEQAFREVARAVESSDSICDALGPWREALERLKSPDRVLHFTVRWTDDGGEARHTPAWRVQHCNVLGPYKGGLRFSPDVNEDTLRFLAFEQSLKNALTGLPLGGGKGGAEFETSDHSEAEVRRFCQAFMDEYARYGGEDSDVPAGDIGTGAREIGWLFGRYAKLTGRHEGALTGKPEVLGGIPGRIEATGYGVVRFAQLVLEERERPMKGSSVAISGAGNVALHAAERALSEGARVESLSNSRGTARFVDGGLDRERLEELQRARSEGTRLEDIADDADWIEFQEGEKPWAIECDLALPCATQNELDEEDAEQLVRGDTLAVVEGANMPCTDGASEVLREGGVLVAPGKAANAGGVVVSGFEMIQNATRDPWGKQDVLERLDEEMAGIHARCLERAREGDRLDYVRGANLASFERLGKAIVAAGIA